MGFPNIRNGDEKKKWTWSSAGGVGSVLTSITSFPPSIALVSFNSELATSMLKPPLRSNPANSVPVSVRRNSSTWRSSESKNRSTPCPTGEAGCQRNSRQLGAQNSLIWRCGETIAELADIEAAWWRLAWIWATRPRRREESVFTVKDILCELQFTTRRRVFHRLAASRFIVQEQRRCRKSWESLIVWDNPRLNRFQPKN